ncbi:hypothetical protein [Nocardia beijingensis]
MAPPTSVPYHEHSDDDFSDRAAGRFEARETTGGYLLIGSCPRCSDSMEFPWVDDAYLNTSQPSGTRRVISMLCTCKGEHAGRDSDGIGCGAYWNLILEES